MEGEGVSWRKDYQRLGGFLVDTFSRPHYAVAILKKVEANDFIGDLKFPWNIIRLAWRRGHEFDENC